MNRITETRALNSTVTLMKVEAPDIAKRAKAGQFIILRVDEKGERIPLTVADTEPLRLVSMPGVVFLISGLGLVPIDMMTASTGISKLEPFFSIGRRRPEASGSPSSISTHSMDLTWPFSSPWISTGFVTTQLEKLIEEGKGYDLVIAIGPVPMMKFVSAVTKKYGIKTIVSLNPIMIDGTGMCGGCRVTVGGETKFACVDGPDFDGHLVDYDGLMKRNSFYKNAEKEKDDHVCRIGLGGKHNG